MKKTLTIDSNVASLLYALNILIRQERDLIQNSPRLIRDINRLTEPHLSYFYQYLISIPYSEFIKTPYWKIISAYTKWRDCCRCVLCNSNKNLEVHHRAYENHGFEHLHLEDLYTFCHNCHNSFHEQNPKIERYDLISK